MPLTQRISFKSILKSNRVIIPQLYRWQYKLETAQVLKVTVNVAGFWNYQEVFLTKMRRDGHLTIPKPVRSSLIRNQPNLEGCDIEVTIEPA